MARTIVITGAFGILGRAVAERARADGLVAALVDVAPAPGGFAHDGPCSAASTSLISTPPPAR